MICPRCNSELHEARWRHRRRLRRVSGNLGVGQDGARVAHSTAVASAVRRQLMSRVHRVQHGGDVQRDMAQDRSERVPGDHIRERQDGVAYEGTERSDELETLRHRRWSLDSHRPDRERSGNDSAGEVAAPALPERLSDPDAGRPKRTRRGTPR